MFCTTHPVAYRISSTVEMYTSLELGSHDCMFLHEWQKPAMFGGPYSGGQSGCKVKSPGIESYILSG